MALVQHRQRWQECAPCQEASARVEAHHHFQRWRSCYFRPVGPSAHGIRAIQRVVESHCHPPDRGFQGVQEALPRLEPAFIRGVSSRYPVRSAQSVGGFHMKHYSWLTDDALSEVSLLFSLVEILSTLPSQIRVVQVALLMKPTGGGVRSSCLFPFSGFGDVAGGSTPNNGKCHT
eukprot:7708654-Pyramimonas_sp.AAC.1